MGEEIQALQAQHPDKSVMLIAEKGTMGVGSSRMSGVNNVALWTGKKASPYIPFVNIAPIVGGTNGISPIFLTTVDVTGGIGIDLKNWVKKTDANGELVRDENGDRKIAAIGIRVARGTVTHGFALNVNPDLRYFSEIVPCGLPDVVTTSLEQELGRSITVKEILPIAQKHLQEALIRVIA
jgi:aconitase B